MKLPALVLLALSCSVLGQSPPLLMGDVAVSKSSIAFTWAGQIWTVSRSGGNAKRLFPDNVSRVLPSYSPDGTQLAFTRISGGELDLFVMPSDGGEAKQLTWHPKGDMMRNWSADGKAILFNSDREQDGSSELYSITLGEPMEKRVAVPSAVHASYSPDGRKIAYNPRSIYYTNVNRRFYRGGSAAPLWIVDLASGAVDKVTPEGRNAIMPMWVGNEIYFLSDELGSFNLAVYDLRTRKTRALTTFGKHGITSAAYGGGVVAYVRDGRIHLYDVAVGKTSEVPVRIDPEELKVRDERARRSVGAGGFLNSFTLSADGKTVLVESRGEILATDLLKGTTTVLTRTAAAEREPVLSPDGSQLAYFSDSVGEYEVCIRQMSDGAERRIKVEPNPTFYRDLMWSPDGKRLSFSDQRLILWCVDVAAGTARKVDTSVHLAQGSYHARWSPDGRWLAYSKALPTRIRAIFLWDASTGRAIQVSDGRSQDELPCFDVSGRYLYFTSSGNARNAAASDIGWALMSNMLAEPFVTKRLCAVILSSTDISPFVAPVVMDGTRYTLDPNGLTRRIVGFPVAGRDIVALEAGAPGSVLVWAQDWSGDLLGGPVKASLNRVDVAAPGRLTKLVDDTQGFAVSADGSTILLDTGGSLFTLPSSAPALKDGEAPATTKIEFGDTKIEVDPIQEWRQMYREAWRMMRDYFYDPNHHGQDAKGLEQHYGAYLPGITRRADLNALLTRAFGEISVSHLRVSGGDTLPNTGTPLPPLRVGLLGADFEAENGRYRITKILRSAHHLAQNALTRAPLDQPGVDVRVGDYLIEVDGQSVTADKNLYAQLAGKGGRPAKVKVSASPSGAGAREYTVVALPGENGLRSANRVRANAELVDKLSGGRLAYVYIAGHDDQGFSDFSAALNAGGDKQGLIIDQRFNPGGITPDVQVQALQRSPFLAYAYRYGNEIVIPVHRLDGPKVLMINEANGSAAETFTVMFKAAKVGTVVGKPTYGGGIGTALFSQRLVDGGSVAIPNRAGYNPLSGQWEIENVGVQPDVQVDLMPADYRAGRDPQLEKAVEIALRQMPGYRKPVLKKPAPPVHIGGRGSL